MGIKKLGGQSTKKGVNSFNSKKKEFRKKEFHKSKIDTSLINYGGKEIFEKFGSGLVSQQYLNVLFSQIGASYFVIGMFQGFKDLFSIITSIFLREYLRIRNPEKWTMRLTGLLFGLSYLIIAIGLFNLSIPLVGLMLIAAGVLSTVLGQVYAKFYILDGQRNTQLKHFPEYSVVLIGIALITGAYILDYYPMFGRLVQLHPNFALPGYFLIIGVAAICFIIASQFLRRILKTEKFEIKTSIWFVVKEHLIKIYKDAPILFKNKVIVVALIASTVTGIVQTLGNIYYGLFIYKMFKYMGFGGFINIAMIFIIALFSALMATTISRMLAKKYGNLPLLTFGTFMVAIQPLIYYFSPNLLSISMATIIGVIGASLTGLAIGLLITHALKKEDREQYYTVFSFLITLPYLICIPVGAYFAQVFGLRTFFLILGLLLICITMPLYLILQIRLGSQIA